MQFQLATLLVISMTIPSTLSFTVPNISYPGRQQQSRRHATRTTRSYHDAAAKNTFGSSSSTRLLPLCATDKNDTDDAADAADDDADDDAYDDISDTVQEAMSLKNPFQFRKRFINRLFDAADRNGDGYVSPEEAYALVLRIYIELNRQAAIPPPSAATVRQFFSDSDTNNDGRVTRSEFDQLATVLLQRATLRLVAHKVVTLLGAPLLAAKVFQSFKDKLWLRNAVQTVVPKPLLPVVTDPTFVRTFLIVGFVASLGNIVLAVVNFFLNRELLVGRATEEEEDLSSAQPRVVD